MPGYSRAIAAASSSTTPSPHSALAILLLMYSPSSQYKPTSSALTAWYARRLAASMSARTSPNCPMGASADDCRRGAAFFSPRLFLDFLGDCLVIVGARALSPAYRPRGHEV